MNDYSKTPIRLTLLGVGIMARHHLQTILATFPNTDIPVVCEPSDEAYREVVALFEDYGRKAPENQPDLHQLLAKYAAELDVAFIITPHVYHHDQAAACMNAGLDILLEKPMVMNPEEARTLIQTRDETGKLLVVAFNGSLSPQIRKARSMICTGELGQIQSISATIWQNWKPFTENTWRQVMTLAGGGFLFDTGAHMLNTVAHLAGEDFVEVAAWLDNNGSPVDILGVVMARLKSGSFVTFHASGATIHSCDSDIRIFCEKGIINIDAWGRWLRLQRQGSPEFEVVNLPPTKGVWEQFLAVRSGAVENPSPPEVGLRMAILWEAIQESAAKGGKPISCDPV